LPPVPLVSLTPAAKFAADVVDTGGGAPLNCLYLREFVKKFKMTLIFFSRAWGRMVQEKNLKQKKSIS
jgi:hypothetical protein